MSRSVAFPCSSAKTRRVGLVFSFAVLIAQAAVAPARGQAIGMYQDEQGFYCSFDAAPYVPTDFYILATRWTDPRGLSGAEFRVDHQVVNQVLFFAEPNVVASVVLGDPMGLGCNLAFPTCQPGPIVVLYTGFMVALTSIQEASLRVEEHTTPSSPNFQCPVLTIHDPPVFTKLCVDGRSASINASWDPCSPIAKPRTQPGQARQGSECVVQVEAASWGGVKGLFR